MKTLYRIIGIALLFIGLTAANPGDILIDTSPTTVPAWGPLSNTEPCITVTPGAGSLAIGSKALRSRQTGSSPYAITAANNCQIVERQQASATSDTIPAATTSGFGDGFAFLLFNIGAGTETLTPTTSTISCLSRCSGGTSLTLTQFQSAYIYSDGANYFAIPW